MRRSIGIVALAVVAGWVGFARGDDPPRTYPGSGGRLVWDRVRFLAAPGHERDMVGGKFSGSNLSLTQGYETLAVIRDAPKPGEWTDLSFDGKRPHRWIRYEAPPGSHGRIGKLEFYAGTRRLGGPGFGSIGRKNPGRDWPRALDANPRVFFESDHPDGQYVGIDVGDAATAVRPVLDPPPGDHRGPIRVSLRTPTPGATIRYTTDGTTPAPDGGIVYSGPIEIASNATITAVSIKDGFAPSPAMSGTYLIGPPADPNLATFHIGNSITATTHDFPKYARTAGYNLRYERFLQPGILTSQLWMRHATANDPIWDKTIAALPAVDHFTVQPREMNVANEAKHEVLFFDLIRKKSPEVQPWLYAEWTDLYRSRPTDRGTVPVPNCQMTTLSPALTWEESAAAMLLYVEEVRDVVLKTYEGKKRPRVLPSVLAAGWIKNLVDRGKIPGMDSSSFEPLIFFDCVHPGRDGAYLIDLTWFAAIYGRSPEGRVLPIGTSLTADQARAFQRLAWEVVENYPDCGLYREGTTAAGEPIASPPPSPIAGVTPVTLSSSTPGAWFRYTLDGTTPTRTRGYIYCGMISVRPGTTLRAVAYKSGMADSSAIRAEYPPSPSPRAE